MKKKPDYWITRGGKHIPIYLDPDKEEQIKKNAEQAKTAENGILLTVSLDPSSVPVNVNTSQQYESFKSHKSMEPNRKRQINANKTEANIQNNCMSNKISGMKKENSLQGNISSKLLTVHKKVFTALNKEFPEVGKYIKKNKNAKIDYYPLINEDGTPNRKTIFAVASSASVNGVDCNAFIYNSNFLDKDLFEDKQALIDYVERNVSKGGKKNHWMECAPEYYAEYLYYHEYGHIIQHYLMNKKYAWTGPNIKTEQDLQNLYRENSKFMISELIACAKKNNIKLDYNELSYYACKQLNKKIYTDVFAEAFANMKCGRINSWGKAMEAYLKQEGLL